MTVDEDNDIFVRVMARSKERENYYRISYTGKGSVDSDGNRTNNPNDTHIDIDDDPDDTVDNILDIIDKITDDIEDEKS